MVEMLITIAVIGILASVATVIYSVTLDQSKKILATNVKETLNTAIHRFNASCYELVYAPTGTGTDEVYVLRTLQYRNPNNPQTGAPFMRNDWDPSESSSTSDYRIAWQGSMFTLLTPGTSGTGLKVAFDGSDLGKTITFPSNFAMAGE